MIQLTGKGKEKRAWFVQHQGIIPTPFVAVTATPEAFRRLIVELGVGSVSIDEGAMSGSDARAWKMARGDNQPVYCVQINHEDLLRRKVNVAGIAGLLAHEATHLSDWMLEDLGEDEPGAEFRANLNQFFVTGLMEAYEKLVPKKERFGGTLK